MKLLIPFFILASVFFSCKEKKVTSNSDIISDTINANQPARDSADIRTVITGFYKWYNANYSKLMEYKLYSSLNKKDGPPYKINWDEVTVYQQFIRDSVPFLGEEFLLNQKKFFAECDSAFKMDKDGEIPYGFDYDWYTNSQDDPKYLVDEINKPHAWEITRSGETAKVDVKGNYDPNEKTPVKILTVWMKKENAEWTIARIGME